MSQGLEFLASTYQPFSFCLTSNSMCGSMLICFRSCQGRDFYFYTWRQKARWWSCPLGLLQTLLLSYFSDQNPMLFRKHWARVIWGHWIKNTVLFCKIVFVTVAEGGASSVINGQVVEFVTPEWAKTLHNSNFVWESRLLLESEQHFGLWEISGTIADFIAVGNCHWHLSSIFRNYIKFFNSNIKILSRIKSIVNGTKHRNYFVVGWVCQLLEPPWFF